MKKCLYALLLCFAPYLLFAQGTADYNKWIIKGFDLYSAGQYKASAQAYTKAFAATGGNATPNDRYSAACSWARAGVGDSAFFHLQYLAAKTNFTDHVHLAKDSDFVSLHTDIRWQQLLDKVAQNKHDADAVFIKPLADMLEAIHEQDQKYRRQFEAIQQKHGNNSPEMRELWNKIRVGDSLNLQKVSAIINKYGWPGPDMVGDDGAATVFLIIQHADIKTQDKYLPQMRNAVKKGKAEAASLAMLEDRVAIAHHRMQQYGTQITTDPAGQFVAPLSDPDHVDRRRASVGLGPLAEYLESFGLKWNVATYKQQLPELEQRQKKID